MKITTIAYKGSKKKLLFNIYRYVEEINAETLFDGFSGTGIVSAFMRSKNITVDGNDLNYSSYIYGKVFLEGYDQEIVKNHLKEMNNLSGKKDWLTENYSGVKFKNAKRKDTVSGEFPLAFTEKNAMKLDDARNYIETLSINEEEKNALIFSVILAANDVFNNTADQKSSFKTWLPKCLNDVEFRLPTFINGPRGKQTNGDIMKMTNQKYDFVYLDPPYSNGVLYSSCYHINDSIAIWDKPTLNYEYALPRPYRADFSIQDRGASFYSIKRIKEDFNKLISNFSSSKRIVISYSDAPKNLISISDLVEISSKYGNVKVENTEHKICTQLKSLNKNIDSLKEYFIIIDQ